MLSISIHFNFSNSSIPCLLSIKIVIHNSFCALYCVLSKDGLFSYSALSLTPSNWSWSWCITSWISCQQYLEQGKMSNALLKLHQRENCFIICLGEIFNKSLYFFVEVMAFASKVAKLSIPEEHLVCPVCLTVPRSSPVRQCNRGHIVCPDC